MARHGARRRALVLAAVGLVLAVSLAEDAGTCALLGAEPRDCH